MSRISSFGHRIESRAMVPSVIPKLMDLMIISRNRPLPSFGIFKTFDLVIQ